MKINNIYGLLAALVMLASCSNDMEQELMEGGSMQEGLFRIESVAQGGFADEAATRATYDANFATQFEENDRLGLILLGENDTRIGHAPFTRNAEGEWNPDPANLLYYSAKVKKVIAYFPYNEQLATNVNSVEALKQSVQVAPNQSTLDSYKQADLLVQEIAEVKSSLSIQFAHAFSLIVLSAQQTLTAGGSDYVYSLDMSNVSFAIGEQLYTPCSLNGAYACVVKDQTALATNDFRYFYQIDGATSAKTVSTSVTTAAATRYTFPCAAASTGGDGIAAGDFYCVDEAKDNQVVIFPGKASAIPAGLTCKGIVFHVWNDTDFSTFTTTNGLADGAIPAGYDGKHGLVVSLQKGGVYGLTESPENRAAIIAALNVESIAYTSRDVANGYILTQKLEKTDLYTNGFTPLANHENIALANATSWYIPSFHEMKYLVRGADKLEDVSQDGQTLIDRQLAKVSGVALDSTTPTITWDDSGGFCLMQNGSEHTWHGFPSGETVRPICAF